MYSDILDFLDKYEQIDATTIKSNLRDMRKSKGLTPKFFEVHAGISTHSYTQLEKVSYPFKPSLESLIRVCYAMNISLQSLL